MVLIAVVVCSREFRIKLMHLRNELVNAPVESELRAILEQVKLYAQLGAVRAFPIEVL